MQLQYQCFPSHRTHAVMHGESNLVHSFPNRSRDTIHRWLAVRPSLSLTCWRIRWSERSDSELRWSQQRNWSVVKLNNTSSAIYREFCALYVTEQIQVWFCAMSPLTLISRRSRVSQYIDTSVNITQTYTILCVIISIFNGISIL